MEFISVGIFEKYSKMKILVFEIFEKVHILKPFSGLAPSKLKIFSKKFNGRICAYRVFYLPLSEESKLRYRKKRGPERVNVYIYIKNLTGLNIEAVYMWKIRHVSVENGMQLN